MALIVSQVLDKSASVKTYAAGAAGGDTFFATSGSFVHIKNAHASVARTVTIAAVTDPVSTAQAGSLAVPDIVANIPAVGDAVIAIPPSHQSAGGLVTMTYDDEADLTLAVLYVGQ